MPIISVDNICPHCGECCLNTCLQQIRCLYRCCGCCSQPVMLGPNQSLLAGQILAQNDNDGRFYPYNPTGDNGLDYPRGILEYNATTDENGRVQEFHKPFIGVECGPLYTNMLVCGIFRIEETIGNLAQAINSPSFGRLLAGRPNGAGSWRLA